LIAVPDHIAEAINVPGLCPDWPWRSFAEFFASRVGDPASAQRVFLTYHDDDGAARRTYTYAQFGEAVQQAVGFLLEVAGLRPGDRLATVLFNHDLTVLLYFAAWVTGVTVVPINVEESPDKKRFIL